MIGNKFIKNFRYSILNTLYLNYKMFPFCKAFYLPVFVERNIAFKGLYKGSIECKEKTGIVWLGTREGSFGMHHGMKSNFIFHKNGKLRFLGKALLQSKFNINVGGTQIIGDKFSSNTGLVIPCGKLIVFGNDYLLGWNVTVIDGDGHKILMNNNIITNVDKAVFYR